MAWYYYAGGAAALAGLALIVKGGSGNRDSSETSPAGTPMSAPLFMASGGGTSQSAMPDNVLGGDPWKPLVTPITDNPDVAIAKINADVTKYAIDQAALLQKSAVDVVAPQPPNTGGSKTEFRNNSIAEGSNFIKSIIPQISNRGNAAVEMDIFNKAKAHNYSATEVAQSFSDATGTKIAAETVNKWLSDRGLSL